MRGLTKQTSVVVRKQTNGGKRVNKKKTLLVRGLTNQNSVVVRKQTNGGKRVNKTKPSSSERVNCLTNMLCIKSNCMGNKSQLCS